MNVVAICMDGTITMQSTNGTYVSMGVRFLARLLLIIRTEQVLSRMLGWGSSHYYFGCGITMSLVVYCAIREDTPKGRF